MSFLSPSAAPAVPSAPGAPAPPPMFGTRPSTGSGATSSAKSGGYAGTILGGTTTPASTSKTVLGA